MILLFHIENYQIENKLNPMPGSKDRRKNSNRPEDLVYKACI